MLRSFLKGAKLRAWLSRPQCPPAVQECKILLDRAYSIRADPFDPLDDIVPIPDAATVIPAPVDLQPLTNQCKAVLRAHVKHGGVVYSRSSTHVGNSLILFYPLGNRSSMPIPGSIKYIYKVDDSLAFAVQRQCTLAATESRNDIFAAHPHFPAKLYSSTLARNLEHVKISWVLGHYARWAVSDSQVVVLSLCRVRTCLPQ